MPYLQEHPTFKYARPLYSYLHRVSSEELSTHLLILHFDILIYILHLHILDPVFWNLQT